MFLAVGQRKYTEHVGMILVSVFSNKRVNFFSQMSVPVFSAINFQRPGSIGTERETLKFEFSTRQRIHHCSVLSFLTT